MRRTLASETGFVHDHSCIDPGLPKNDRPLQDRFAVLNYGTASTQKKQAEIFYLSGGPGHL